MRVRVLNDEDRRDSYVDEPEALVDTEPAEEPSPGAKFIFDDEDYFAEQPKSSVKKRLRVPVLTDEDSLDNRIDEPGGSVDTKDVEKPGPRMTSFDEEDDVIDQPDTISNLDSGISALKSVLVKDDSDDDSNSTDGMISRRPRLVIDSDED